MNYRHIYHAGHFPDVVKHAVVCLIVEHLKKKETPFFVLDTHAGAGRYDLTSTEAQKTGEFRDGIGRLLAIGPWPPALAPYLAVVRAINGGSLPANADGLAVYPGSPRLVRALMRPKDRLIAAELHPVDAATLAAEFTGDPQVAVKAMDGYGTLTSLLPPREKRGLVLVDPPFEEKDEFAALVDGLVAAHRRWATGIFTLWFPIKDRRPVEDFYGRLAESGVRRLLLAELLVRAADDPERLNGTGLAIVNPPWRLDDTLNDLLPFFVRALGQGPGAASRVAWLVPE
jgi:23S rRNA (adenine2030-N6)-methyltransferase